MQREPLDTQVELRIHSEDHAPLFVVRRRNKACDCRGEARVSILIAHLHEAAGRRCQRAELVELV